MHTDPSQRREIGVFDSGVGGFTVLRELRTLLPTARLRYLADTAYAPYGNRSPEDIRARSFAISEHLIERGADLIVIACNTATAHASRRCGLDGRIGCSWAPSPASSPLSRRLTMGASACWRHRRRRPVHGCKP